jgi:hypothetical protein
MTGPEGSVQERRGTRDNAVAAVVRVRFPQGVTPVTPSGEVRNRAFASVSYSQARRHCLVVCCSSLKGSIPEVYMRNLIASLAACTLLCAASYASEDSSSPPVADNATADASVSLKGGSVAAGIGYTWGHGELKYRDALHQFPIKGVSLVDVGATNYTAAGSVYNLTELSDFTGNYVAAGAGIAVAGGGTAVYLKNERGVIIKLLSTDVGLKFKLSADGVHIALKR